MWSWLDRGLSRAAFPEVLQDDVNIAYPATQGQGPLAGVRAE